MTGLAGHARIALDSNVLIYLLEGDGALAEAAARIVDAIELGEVAATMSAVGLAEVLAGPARTGDAHAFEATADALRDLRLAIVTLDAATAEDAAWIRGSLGLTLQDAVHLASARQAGASAFVTNDRRIRSLPRLDVLYLDDLDAGAAT